jgi:hypothetical protein
LVSRAPSGYLAQKSALTSRLEYAAAYAVRTQIPGKQRVLARGGTERTAANSAPATIEGQVRAGANYGPTRCLVTDQVGRVGETRQIVLREDHRRTFLLTTRGRPRPSPATGEEGRGPIIRKAQPAPALSSPARAASGQRGHCRRRPGRAPRRGRPLLSARRRGIRGPRNGDLSGASAWEACRERLGGTSRPRATLPDIA